MKACAGIFLFLSFAFFYSCKDDEAVVITPTDYNYFPVTTGHWIVYDVDSTVHLDIDDNTNQTDTSIVYYSYQIKETIDSSFIDGEGDRAYRILREKRMNDTLPWAFLNYWTCKRNYNSAQKVEDNVRYVKLSFPVQSGNSWNGNAFNTIIGDDFRYEDVNVPMTVGTNHFDSTATVSQVEFISLINRIISKEVYAFSVGMVSKQKDSININGLGQVLNGIEFQQTVNSYGE
jgi:hypothetical protein